MPAPEETDPRPATQAAYFKTTHWSVVLAAGQQSTPQSRCALETLCRAYWYPLYSYLRRQGKSVHDAQDLTQSFIARLLEKNALQSVSPVKGKFRSFLLVALRNFLTNEWDKSQSLKRGAAVPLVSIDEEFGENRFRHEPSHDVTPDRAFEQSWALTVIETVLAQLRLEYQTDGKADLFEALQGYLSGNRSEMPYVETAARLNLSEGAVKMAVLRLRRRFGELLRAEIQHTVSQPEEINDEIRCLFAAVST